MKIYCNCKKILESNFFKREIHLYTITRKHFASSTVVTEDYVRNQILSEGNKQKLLRRLSKVRHGLKLNPAGKDAGVLVPLCIVKEELSLLYTVRSRSLSSHAGQVSFPGGLMDDTDSSSIDAALRETEEELGFDRNKINVWADMGIVPDRRGIYRVNAVLGFLGNLELEKLDINKQEVHKVFTMPLTHLLTSENLGYTTFRNGWRMPVIKNARLNIWGMTAIFTDVLLANAFPDKYQLIVSQYQGDISRKYL